MADHPHRRFVVLEPCAEASDGPRGSVGLKGDHLRVSQQQPDCLAVVVFVPTREVDHQRAVVDPQIGDAAIEDLVEARHQGGVPDPTAGPEAAVAAYWLEVADVLVLPTTSARADFNGALDYLEVAGLPPTLVPYIVSVERRLRDNPTTVEYLAAIRRGANRIVEVPDEANAVRLAAMEGVPAQQLSPRLGLAYRELTEAIAGMPRRLSL
jgi:hypothetical protein